MTLQQVTVEIENIAPQNGTAQTPFWIGFHDGFDTYDRGRPASPGVESLAEDGDTSLLSEEFAFSGLGQVDATVGAAPIAPGDTATLTLTIDTSVGDARYFSYASMVLPSNDTFIANGNEFAHEVFDEDGNFIPLDITVAGSEALDAGTEVNDELPANTAFFGQQTPDTGVDQNEGVQLATGFNDVGSGGILDSPDFANADYTADGYNFVRIRVTAGPTVIRGTADSDVLTGTPDGELISGLGGDDAIAGAGGNDSIFGGSGRDTISGDGGNDTLFGGRGVDNDVIAGGAGRDRFILAPNTGTDVILDFTVGEDVFVLTEGLTFGQLDITQAGNKTTIGADDSGLIAILKDVDAETVTAESFVAG